MAIRRIGQSLVDLGFIDDDHLEMLLEEQQGHPGDRLGKIAQDMGLVTDDQLALALAEQMGMQVIQLADVVIPEEVIGLVTEPMAQLYRIVPIQLDGDVFTVATCDPQNLSIQDELRTFLGYDIRLVVATEREIDHAIDEYYAEDAEPFESLVSVLEGDNELQAAVDNTSRLPDDPIRSCERQRAHEPGRARVGAALGEHPFDGRELLGVRLAVEPRRLHAGFAVQRIDLETGILGDRELAGGAGVAARLQPRVLGER